MTDQAQGWAQHGIGQAGWRGCLLHPENFGWRKEALWLLPGSRSGNPIMSHSWPCLHPSCLGRPFAGNACGPSADGLVILELAHGGRKVCGHFILTPVDSVILGPGSGSAGANVPKRGAFLLTQKSLSSRVTHGQGEVTLLTLWVPHSPRHPRCK